MVVGIPGYIYPKNPQNDGPTFQGSLEASLEAEGDISFLTGFHSMDSKDVTRGGVSKNRGVKHKIIHFNSGFLL